MVVLLINAYWLPITATIVIGLLVSCGVYLKNKPSLIWRIGCLVIAALALSGASLYTSKAGQIKFILMYLIFFIFTMFAAIEPSLVLSYIRVQDFKKSAVNFSNSWFDWLKWTTIIAAISYIQVQTSDEILDVIVKISYLALFINIFIHLLPIFNIWFEGRLDGADKSIKKDAEAWRFLSLYISVSILYITFLIINYLIDKIHSARISMCS